METIKEINKSMDDVDLVIDNDHILCLKICDLLSKYKTFYIPDFQRFYIWNRRNVKQLYRDIKGSIENKDELFLGNSILKEIRDHNIEIIDGQQRIVTMLILLRCILDTKKAARSHVEYFEGILENINIGKESKIKLLDPTPVFFEKYILKTMEINDLADFTNQNIDPINKIISSKKILEEELKGLTGIELNILSNFIIKYIKIVTIFPMKLENEIYDSINSKGVPLTEADKIKNFLFKTIDKERKQKLYKNWYELLKLFDYSSRKVSSFIELYWTITKEDPKKNLYKKLVELFENKEQDIISFSKELLDYAKIYSQIINTNLDKIYWGKGKYGIAIAEIINNLRYLDMKTSYYLIMEVRYSFNTYFEKKGKREFMEEIVDLFSDIERYSFLHINLFGGYPQELKSFYSKKSISLKKSKDRKKEVLRNTKKEFTEKINKLFEGNRFKDRIFDKCHFPDAFTRKEKIYLFYKLLKHLIKTDIFDKNINAINEKTIEHIMPENLSDWWREKIKGYLKKWKEYPKRNIEERISKYHATFLNDVGNLSLLTSLTNTELGNKSFNEKIEILREKEKDNRLFETVFLASEWSNIEINLRRELLINHLIEIFL